MFFLMRLCYYIEALSLTGDSSIVMQQNCFSEPQCVVTTRFIERTDPGFTSTANLRMTLKEEIKKKNNIVSKNLPLEVE